MKIVILAVIAFLGLFLFVPSFVPVAELGDTVPARELAGPDSRFVELNGQDIHYTMSGEGSSTILLLHGFGASLRSWDLVVGELARDARVVAYDRLGFGLSARPLPPYGSTPNPYDEEREIERAVALLDALGVERAVLVGHSAGGAIALQVALRNPERVSALVLEDAAVYGGGGIPRFVIALMSLPQFDRLGPLVSRTFQTRGREIIELAWFDPSRIPQTLLDGYLLPLRASNWDRALWEFTKARRAEGLPGQLGEIRIPALVLTGDSDAIVAPENAERLAAALPSARLVVVPECGHIPHEERPELFLSALRNFLRE